MCYITCIAFVTTEHQYKKHKDVRFLVFWWSQEIFMNFFGEYMVKELNTDCSNMRIWYWTVPIVQAIFNIKNISETKTVSYVRKKKDVLS
jgi:hypothetical protein